MIRPRVALPRWSRASWAAVALLAAAVLLAGCAGGPPTVCITVDGGETCMRTEGKLAYEVLRDAGVQLGPNDRVLPGYWSTVDPNQGIRVVRVEQVPETEEREVPYDRRTVLTLTLPPGQSRLLQAGVPGLEEVTYLVTTEDGVRVSREAGPVRPLSSPQDEVVAVGMDRASAPKLLTGTLAYLAQGDAWLVRGDPGSARLLTSVGDLDGRVFELAPGAHELLLTRRMGEESSDLNGLFVVSTDVEEPVLEDLQVPGVLRAAWSPNGSSIAYTTGTKAAGSPGWQARNDVWVMSWPDASIREVRPAHCAGVACWWGLELAWTDDGGSLLLSDPGCITRLDLATGAETELLTFPPLATGGSWAWVPRVSLIPNTAQAVMALPYEAGAESRPDTRFDVTVVDLQSKERTVLVEGAGAWSNPEYGPALGDQRLLAYGLAAAGGPSTDATYAVWVADADGSDALVTYPSEGSAVVYEVAWSAEGLLIVGAEEGIFLCDAQQASVTALLQGVPVERVQWGE